jgi:predicted transcriptional regulator
VDRIRPSLEEGRDVYCYFKHEDEGLSTKMADRLRAMLSPSADADAVG